MERRTLTGRASVLRHAIRVRERTVRIGLLVSLTALSLATGVLLPWAARAATVSSGKAIPLTVAIAPLPGNSSRTPTPTFTFSAGSAFAPTAPAVMNVYYQVDTFGGAWLKATPDGASGTGTTPVLARGMHTIYAFAADPQMADSVNTGFQSSPLIGTIQAYTFLVFADTVPPVTTITGLPVQAAPAPLSFGLSAADPNAGTGVAATSYKLDGGATQSYTTTVTLTSVVGSRTVDYWSTDVAGNVETTHRATCYVAGPLSQTGNLAPGSFATALTGTAQVLSGTGFGGFQVSDLRGSGLGWTVAAQATPFTNTTRPGHNLSLNSFTMPQLGVTGKAGASAIPGALHAPASIDTGFSGVVMAATTGSYQGMGVFDFTTTSSGWKLGVPGNAFSGSYASTVTITIAPAL